MVSGRGRTGRAVPKLVWSREPESPRVLYRPVPNTRQVPSMRGVIFSVRGFPDRILVLDDDRGEESGHGHAGAGPYRVRAHAVLHARERREEAAALRQGSSGRMQGCCERPRICNFFFFLGRDKRIRIKRPRFFFSELIIK